MSTAQLDERKYRELLDETLPVVIRTEQEHQRLLHAAATRRYAKRQITFFRSVPGVLWMSPDDSETLRRHIEAFLA